MYPNPSKDRFTIEGSLTEAISLQITIFDMTGRKVFEQNMAKTSYLKTEIDLSNFGSGLYLLVLSDKGEQQGKLRISKRLIKEN